MDEISLITLLSRHGYVKALFGCDEVVVAVRAQINLHPVDLTSELACFSRVVRGHVGASVMTDITCLVGREGHRIVASTRPSPVFLPS